MNTQPVSRNMPERMDLPFVGLATFAGQPACTDWDKLDGADVAVLGIPIDTASSYRVGTRFGLRAIRVEGRSGAWLPASPERGLPDRKVGAIGARVARGVTMHGLALNCDCDLSWYDRIVPCGIRDAGVTSLTAETGIRVSVSDVTPLLERHLAGALGYRTWRRIHTVTPLVASAA